MISDLIHILHSHYSLIQINLIQIHQKLVKHNILNPHLLELFQIIFYSVNRPLEYFNT